MNQKPSVINIALVGGGELSREILDKTAFVSDKEIHTPILAVADPDPESPGMVIARQRGLQTFRDYHDLYNPRYNIHLIIVLTPEPEILRDVLETRPFHIRILSRHVFEVFWSAIGLEERKLRERTKEMETILNGIQDIISVITPKMKIAEVNDAFLKQMGRSREEVIGLACYEVFQNKDHMCQSEGFVCPLEEAIRNKRPTRQIMTRLNSRNEENYFEVNIFPIWEKNGKISKFIEISRDITKRLKAEEEITHRLEQMVEERTQQLKETHAKLLHQDKMASLGKLSASVVHEINNPIAGILNLIILIKRIISEGDLDPADVAQVIQYLNLMETETRRTSRIVSNLLAFSRQSKTEFKRLNLNELIDRTLFLNSNLLKINQVTVKKRFSPGIPHIIGSEDQLQQVFMNIVSNAAEAMESKGGGNLTIETAYLKSQRKIEVSFSDTGVGIPELNFPKLFEPFFTTKKNGKGLGLGLSVAYSIIKEHNGSIQAQSEPGKGTVFTVDFPLEP